MDIQKLNIICRTIKNMDRMVGVEDSVYCACCNKVYDKNYYYKKHKDSNSHRKKRFMTIDQLQNTEDPRVVDVVLYIAQH
jgi:Rps23 Pro-64 3,4-dihydroxylase Tpa1-like proline 4-hydroxylase